jgi:tetratricopeptide (TPR) repeat protein/tRNA A-37 threonylcarbamoyl transferase component Bud32
MIGKNISRYRILGQVGEGGMGVVYVAEDTVLGRRVAVKIPHAGKDESHYRARFLREARAVSKLRHENIAAVHDYGETEDGQPFIVMELVSGQTLGDLLSGAGISIGRAVEVARQTAEALSEAHRLGVVHRDIKPSNVVIDDAGVVKVLDFGLAKQLHEEGTNGTGPEAQTLLTARTRSDVVIGTPLYLSPEQARGAKVDGRSDLFALGALLYECLTGRPAFSGANVIEIGAQVLHFDPPPPSKLNPRVPAELDRLALKALAKKPEDRFQTAAEMAAELARVGARLPASDTVPTRRLAGADNGHRSSALTTMAEGLRRPKFSPLALLASLAGLALVIWAVWYLRQPSAHVPEPPVARLYEQGVEAMREGSYYKASGLLTQAVEKDGDFALARARLAEAYLEMDFVDRAKDEMLAVNRLAPDFSVYERPEALYLEAVSSTLGREYAEAVKRYEEIVKLDPRPPSHLDLGRAYERNNMPEQALNSYTTATTNDNSYAAAFLRLGTLHVRRRNQPGAADALNRAQKLYAERGDREGEAAVRYQRGRLFAGNGKRAEARAEFEQALRLARDASNPHQEVQALLQLASVKDDGADALKTAQDAIGLAQSSGMNDQVANGHLTQGNIFFASLGEYDQAEEAYRQALNFARTYKLLRYEALALVNLGSLYDKRGLPDEAERHVAPAREFFVKGDFRREADQCATIIARSRKRKGDYAAALAIFEEQLRAAEQASDMAQVGALHRECGAVLLLQEKYQQALDRFGESHAVARALNNQTQLTYSLINRAAALWPLGRYAEAAEAIGQVTRADPKTLGVGKDAVAIAYVIEADMALSRMRYAEAEARARQALAVVTESKGQSSDLLSLIQSDLGVAESLGGSHAEGRALCEEAVRMLPPGQDVVAVARANFALALARLEAGDAAGARDAAVRAQEIYTRLGRADSEWRALAVAGKASRLAGDQNAAREYFSRAAASLSQLEQSLGADAASYRARPDVQWLRGELGGSVASVVR